MSGRCCRSPANFVAEVKTRRFDDRPLRDRALKPKTTSSSAEARQHLPPTPRHRSCRAAAVLNEDDNVDYDVTDYDIDASYFPEAGVDGSRTRINLRIKSHALGVLTLRFARA